MENIKVSIIVPVYNVEKYLDRCMQSLLNQTLNDIEIILVDDGSPDRCPQICDEYGKKDPRVKVIHKHNEGLGLARNSGLAIANGEYVAFVDSDDFVDVNIYCHLYEYAEANNCDAVFCGYNIYNDQKQIRTIHENTENVIKKGKHEVENVLLDMIGSEPSYHSDTKLLMSVWRAIYSRKVIDDHALRFVSERIYISEDIIWHIDFISHCNCIGLIPDAYYYYCVNATSLTRSYYSDRFEKEIFLYYAQKERLCDAKYSEEQFKNRLNRQLILKARGCISQQVCFMHQLGYLTARKNIAKIVESKEIDDILNTYPYQSLPIKHRLFFLLMKWQSYDLLILLLRFQKQL